MSEMTWARYEELCDAPYYFTATMLRRSLAALAAQPLAVGTAEAEVGDSAAMSQAIAATLRAALALPPLPFPPGHTADPRVAMYRLELSRSQANHMVALFCDQIGFHAAWLEHYNYLGERESEYD